MNRRGFLASLAAVAALPALPKPSIADSIAAGDISVGTIDASKIIVSNLITSGHLFPNGAAGDIFLMDGRDQYGKPTTELYLHTGKEWARGHFSDSRLGL